jgi:hypothetical protein
VKKIRIPTDWRAFTVGQWMKAASNAENPLAQVAALSNYTADELRSLPKKAVDSAAVEVGRVLATKPTRFHSSFSVDDLDYRFIDHWEELTTGEYIDLEAFGGELEKNAHKFLSVCYRPTQKKWYGERLVPYEGPVTADKMRRIPAEVLASAVLFFCLGKEAYWRNLGRSLAARGRATLAVITDGTTPSTSSPEKTPQKSKK